MECARIRAERRALELEAGLSLSDFGVCNSLLSEPTSNLVIKLYYLYIKLIKSRQ